MARGKGKKAVIFDLDNTLIDFTETKSIAIRESIKAMIDKGIDADFDALLEDFTEFYWKRGIEDQHIFQKYLLERYGKIDYRVLAGAILAYRKAKEGVLRPYPGTKDMLISLKNRGYRLAILSDAPKLEAYLRLCAMGLDDFFDVIITKDDTGVLKPHKKAFLAVSKALSIPPSGCIMVGDMPGRDIDGAKVIGMKTIFAQYGHRNGEDGSKADYAAKSIKDIERIIKAIERKS
jgi:putative hydrolase of the HAD superfamily